MIIRPAIKVVPALTGLPDKSLPFRNPDFPLTFPRSIASQTFDLHRFMGTIQFLEWGAIIRD
ncbi:hypothetical protein G3N57_31815 [Paraburkholderia sp. Se-20369]|nr:hypothetical protein [Paraburkholderia sp. Se-20369]